MALKILVLGDSYYRVGVFEDQFRGLTDEHRVRFGEVRDGRDQPEAGEESRVREYTGSSRQVIDMLRDEDVLVVHGAPVTAAVLEAAPSLQLVCVARGGPVNVDLEAAADHGVRVVTTPGKNAEAVGDLTVAFMIMLARGIAGASAHLLHGAPIGESAFEGGQWFGRELAGSRLGVVGLGRVGHTVVRRATALGMSVQGCDPFLPRDEFPDGVAPAELSRLLATSDFVSLHARASSENDAMFGAEQFALMPEGAYFINTARASLVDERALGEALRSGRLAGAAVDVLLPHRSRGLHPLLALDRVIATPHIGGATRETLARAARMIAEELDRFAAGEPLVNTAEPGTKV